jgi:hypothetical protein
MPRFRFERDDDFWEKLLDLGKNRHNFIDNATIKRKINCLKLNYSQEYHKYFGKGDFL